MWTWNTILTISGNNNYKFSSNLFCSQSIVLVYVIFLFFYCKNFASEDYRQGGENTLLIIWFLNCSIEIISLI